MKLLLTGGCGFVGHHLVEGVLKNTDWDIVILDCLDYAGTLNKIEGVPERLADIENWEKVRNRIRFVWHDLRAPISETVDKLIGKVDVIWHLAAQSHVDRSLEDSIPFVMSNVLGTAHLLEWIKKKQKQAKTIIFSSDEVFGPAPKGVYYKEDDRHRPSNPYAATKSGEEMLAYSFAHSFKLPIFIVRSMNILGERQHYEKFVPKTVGAILRGEPVIIHGTPEIGFSSRCWIHAREVCNALIFLTDKGEPEQFYHIVGEERDVLSLARRIYEIIKETYPETKPLRIECVDFHKKALRPGHDFRYALSGEKLRKMGFRYTIDFEESFEKMIKWMIKPENRKWLGLDT